MSRRRATDGEEPLLDDDTDLDNAKKRTPAERAGLFFRRRPVTSLLLVVFMCALALLTFAVGRYVGRALMPASTGPVSDDVVDDFDAKDGEVAVDGADAARGAVVRDVADAAGGDDADGADVEDADVKPRVCWRKYEPGKLGWAKILCVTDEFYFDIKIGDEAAGTLVIGVFGEVVPKSAANFRALATCTGEFADEKLCFRGDSFHRVVQNFVIQGGSKATGRSIYGPTFREEKEKDHHSFLQHAEKGVVSWAEYPIGSQFFITLSEVKYLDGNHVVFGWVTEGLDVLDKIHNAPRNGEQPLSRISVADCGDLHK